MAETLTSHLEALNIMLSCIGMAPINTEVGTLTADVVMAQNILNEVCRDVQSMDWHFNSEDDYPLVRAIDNTIPLPPNLLRIDRDANRDWNIDIVQRGTRLYDRKNRSFTFTQDVKASVVLDLPWDDLPQPARRYIYIRAARIYVDRAVGAAELEKFTRTDEEKALADLQEFDGDTAEYNIFNNYQAARPLIRWSSGQP
jgi:hypothetical protein